MVGFGYCVECYVSGDVVCFVRYWWVVDVVVVVGEVVG